VRRKQRKITNYFAFLPFVATNSEGLPEMCRKIRGVVANTSSEKHQKALWAEKIALTLQRRKEQTTSRRQKLKHKIHSIITLKKIHYEKEFNLGKEGAHEHRYRSNFHIRTYRM
jgi:hypothetical protein